MESLETQVREGLIQKAAQATYEAMQKPEYQALMKDQLRAMVISLPAETFKDEESAGKLCAIFETGLDTFLSNPEQLRLQAYTLGRNQYLTRERVALLLGLGDDQLEPEERREFLDAVTKEMEPLYPILDARENVVRELVALAKREGIEKALADEAEYAAIRKVFPMKDAYVTNQLSGIKVAEESFGYLQETLMGGEDNTFGLLGRGLANTLEVVARKEVLKRAGAIYGA